MSPLNYMFNTDRHLPRRISALAFSYLLLTSLSFSQPVHTELPAVSTSSPAKKIEWRTDLDAALAEAKQHNKLVLLRFTAEWCAPCRVMDARVWPDSAVQTALAEKYLIVKSDIDVEGSEVIARKYGVQAIPTLLVLDSDGNELERGGFMSSQELIKFLESAAKTKGESDPPGGVSS